MFLKILAVGIWVEFGVFCHFNKKKKIQTCKRFCICAVLFLQQADSEGELCLADSLASAGSNSTLASSVIEVEAERPEGNLIQGLQTLRDKMVFSSSRNVQYTE